MSLLCTLQFPLFSNSSRLPTYQRKSHNIHEVNPRPSRCLGSTQILIWSSLTTQECTRPPSTPSTAKFWNSRSLRFSISLHLPSYIFFSCSSCCSKISDSLVVLFVFIHCRRQDAAVLALSVLCTLYLLCPRSVSPQAPRHNNHQIAQEARSITVVQRGAYPP